MKSYFPNFSLFDHLNVEEKLQNGSKVQTTTTSETLNFRQNKKDNLYWFYKYFRPSQMNAFCECTIGEVNGKKINGIECEKHIVH